MIRLARSFLEEVERFSVSMVRIVSGPLAGVVSTEDGQRLASEMARLKVFVNPLLARIPSGDRTLLEGGSPEASEQQSSLWFCDDDDRGDLLLDRQ
jgi:hypothetical protein